MVKLLPNVREPKTQENIKNNNYVKGHVHKWLKMIPAKERRERRKERRRIKEGMT